MLFFLNRCVNFNWNGSKMSNRFADHAMTATTTKKNLGWKYRSFPCTKSKMKTAFLRVSIIDSFELNSKCECECNIIAMYYSCTDCTRLSTANIKIERNIHHSSCSLSLFISLRRSFGRSLSCSIRFCDNHLCINSFIYSTFN